MSEHLTQKHYFALHELEKKYSVSAGELIHYGAHNGLPIYVLADSWQVMPVIFDSLDNKWINASPSPLSVSGLLRLLPETLIRLEANPSAMVTEVLRDPDEVVEYEPDEEWRYRLLGKGVSLGGCKIVIKAKDCESMVIRLVSEISGEEIPIRNPRERDNLYNMMLALAKVADYDFAKHPTKYAEALAEVSQGTANRVSARSIENHFKKALMLVENKKT